MATQHQLPAIRRLTDWLGYIFDHYFLIVLCLMTALLLVYQLSYGFLSPLFTSGWITLLIGIRLARNLPSRVDETIKRLAHRGSIDLEPGRLSIVKQHLEAQTKPWIRWSGIVVGFLIFLSFYFVWGWPTIDFFPLAATLAGVIAGRFMGRTTAYGRLARFFKNEQIRLKVQPGHLDGAAGLKPIGDFYFFQAMLLAIPAIFLAVWWVLFPYYYNGSSPWREPYAALLFVALIFEMLAFLVPLWSFHQDMQAQKTKLLEQADDLSQRIVALQAQLIEVNTDQERRTLQEQLALMTEHYYLIERMPTWPVDVRVRRRFTLGNLVLFLPLVGQLLSTAMTGPQKTIFEKLQDILTKLLQG